ncbi:MAG: MarR family transcriptional regulator [Phreatobacter sp.]|uniref:MarR family winged helix-turn-helix transcriptional regulator n=1 Tax=Phreatobacter sp. TaxID=1966341 RepID=UPI001A466BE3|nr:MarR family transcriptional regulator [Phreatobacter sp.]MBL8567992.1 MarR family transcriptional regulator [Phreatobacter sp.]
MLDPKPAERGPAAAMPAKLQRPEGADLITPAVRALAELVEQVNRIVYGLGFSGGVNPAQWAALRYFSRAPEGRRTVGGLAEYQCVTAPTASETVSALVRKGYVERRPSLTDKRSHTLILTAEGQALLRMDPQAEVAVALKALTDDQRLGLAEALDVLQRQLLARRQLRRNHA